VHHSALKILDGNDGIIVGASSVKQLNETLEDIEKGPLPEDVLKVLDEAWEITRSSAPTYWNLDLKYGYDFDEK
jgi:aflatoxin B1 aldehyde reductase